ncbi:uncharacterized protein LOC110704677 [Chenopodium quinoa]|uniref:uncharacterized protein LOC110704677 n=1 Tax=Chenopodium quinoa TaxID=63459 RepID=UPI000B780010|nr:uncharacterized protein LOC110704677 [Chenopodium quinoa]
MSQPPPGWFPWPGPWGVFYPPCPYPSQVAPWRGSFPQHQPSLPQHRPSQQGLLGPAPRHQQAALIASAPSQDSVSSTATYGLQSSSLPYWFSAMSLQAPDQNWYMDTGATSHLINDTGINSSMSSFNPLNSHIFVGDGSKIPVTSTTTSTLPNPFPPFLLRNTLYTPKIIKNLISIRQFTSDNNVYVEFDPFGFPVKDLRTGKIMTQCNSVRSLYPLSAANTSSSSPSVFAALSSDVWHNRLGHPGNQVIDFLGVII